MHNPRIVGSECRIPRLLRGSAIAAKQAGPAAAVQQGRPVGQDRYRAATSGASSVVDTAAGAGMTD